MSRNGEDALPDGLSDEHLHSPGGWRRRGGVIALIALSLLMVAALVGLAGVEETLAEESEVATVAWHAPQRIRNGQFLEMRLQVDAHERIDELVVGIDASLWEDFTINTLIPAAAEEASEDG